MTPFWSHVASTQETKMKSMVVCQVDCLPALARYHCPCVLPVCIIGQEHFNLGHFVHISALILLIHRWSGSNTDVAERRTRYMNTIIVTVGN